MAVGFEVISTGSQGNAVVISDNILVDCGVSFKQLGEHYKKLVLVLLTHIHSDHFNSTTIGMLAGLRPTLRFAAASWLVSPLLQAGVDAQNIDVVEPNMRYSYGFCSVEPVPLVHNVPNIGYKIHLADGYKVFYATDTNNLNGITAPGYDLYLVEANYDPVELEARIQEKREQGVFAYETLVKRNHLSIDKCNDFIYRNIGKNGEYAYLHGHVDREA